MRRHFLAVAGRILFLGFSVQIVLGLFWMLCNLEGLPPYGGNTIVTKIGGDMGLLLYLLQLGAAFGAVYRLLRSLSYELWNRMAAEAGAWKSRLFLIWGSLALLTFPSAMQCHLAALPDSLAASCLILEFALGTELLRKQRKMCCRSYVPVLACWLTAALLQSEYLYFGAVPALLLGVFGIVMVKKNGEKGSQKSFFYVILLVCFTGLILSVTSLLPAKFSGKNEFDSAEFSLCSRFIWPHAGIDYDFWPGEVKAVVTKQEALQTDFYAENMELVLGDRLFDKFGEEQAEALLREMAGIAWQHHKGEILHDIVWDALGYAFSPLVLQRQLTGRVYDSYTGRNYDMLRANTPYLSKYYLDYGCWWYGAGMVMTAVFSLTESLGKRRGREKKEPCHTAGRLLNLLLLFGAGCLMTAVYTLRGAGMMDYKKTIAVGILWLAWMVQAAVKGIRLPTVLEPEKEKAE